MNEAARRWATRDHGRTCVDEQNVPPRMKLAEASAYVGCARRTLGDSRWRRRHRVPAIRLGRLLLFDRAALDAWLGRHREPLPRPAGPGERDEGTR